GADANKSAHAASSRHPQAMNRKLGATSGVSGGRRSVVMVRGASQGRSGPPSDDHCTDRPATILSTGLWKTMGTTGLTCPQAATYRGSVGVEPAVSCCAPCGTHPLVLRRCAGLHQRQIYQWICRQFCDLE